MRWNKNKFALGNNRVPAREKEKQRDGVLNPNAWKANMIARRTPGEYLVLRTKHSDTQGSGRGWSTTVTTSHQLDLFHCSWLTRKVSFVLPWTPRPVYHKGIDVGEINPDFVVACVVFRRQAQLLQIDSSVSCFRMSRFD